MGAEFQKEWERDFAAQPQRPDMLCGVVNTFLGDPSLVDPGQYLSLGTYTAYPYSRGRIHINSAEDVLTGYNFDAGFFNHPSDLKKQLWAYKMSREIARRLPFYRGELELGHPKFPAGSAAALVDLSTGADEKHPVNGAGTRGLEDIRYSKEDDAAIEDWIRGNIGTTWHSLGTCAMRPLADGGVVDERLNVHGTQSLKVADLSMVPENVGANTNNTALVVGEKAAILIARDLGVEV